MGIATTCRRRTKKCRPRLNAWAGWPKPVASRIAGAGPRPLAGRLSLEPPFCRTQEEEDEGYLGDLGPSDLPPLESDEPPPLESAGAGKDDGPPPLEPDISQMKEVD